MVPPPPPWVLLLPGFLAVASLESIRSCGYSVLPVEGIVISPCGCPGVLGETWPEGLLQSPSAARWPRPSIAPPISTTPGEEGRRQQALPPPTPPSHSSPLSGSQWHRRHRTRPASLSARGGNQACSRYNTRSGGGGRGVAQRGERRLCTPQQQLGATRTQEPFSSHEARPALTGRRQRKAAATAPPSIWAASDGWLAAGGDESGTRRHSGPSPLAPVNTIIVVGVLLQAPDTTHINIHHHNVRRGVGCSGSGRWTWTLRSPCTSTRTPGRSMKVRSPIAERGRFGVSLVSPSLPAWVPPRPPPPPPCRGPSGPSIPRPAAGASPSRCLLLAATPPPPSTAIWAGRGQVPTWGTHPQSCTH